MVIISINQHYFKVTKRNRQVMPGIRKDSGPQRYNKVNQQRKFHLLSLFYTHQVPLKEAAHRAGVNYLTAKTIIFFHKKEHKSYQFDLRLSPKAQNTPKIRASYTSLRRNNQFPAKIHPTFPTVQVFCSTGSVLTSSSCNEISDIVNSSQKNIEQGEEDWGGKIEDEGINYHSIKWSEGGSRTLTPKFSHPGSCLHNSGELARLAQPQEKANRLLSDRQNMRSALPVKLQKDRE